MSGRLAAVVVGALIIGGSIGTAVGYGLKKERVITRTETVIETETVTDVVVPDECQTAIQLWHEISPDGGSGVLDPFISQQARERSDPDAATFLGVAILEIEGLLDSYEDLVRECEAEIILSGS